MPPGRMPSSAPPLKEATPWSDELWEHSWGSAMGLSQLDDALEVYWAGHPDNNRVISPRLRCCRPHVLRAPSDPGPLSSSLFRNAAGISTCLQCGARPRVLDPAHGIDGAGSCGPAGPQAGLAVCGLPGEVACSAHPAGRGIPIDSFPRAQPPLPSRQPERPATAL